MKTNKIVVLGAAIVAFILMFPMGIDQLLGNSPFLCAIRYLLAATMAIPTAIYAIRKYRRTSSRFYVVPCFTVALGFWVTSMFVMQKQLPDSMHENPSNVAVEQDDFVLYNRSQPAKVDNIFHLTDNQHYNAYDEGEALFFLEKFNPEID